MPDLDPLLPAIVNLPAGDIDQLIESARQGHAGLDSLRARTGSNSLRNLCDALLHVLDASSVDSACGWLRGAASAVAAIRAEQQIDVVWTGSESDVDTGRFTSQVIVGLIEEAQAQLLLASYATNPDERTLNVLSAAARRGVNITVLQERHEDNPGYHSGFDPFANLPIRRLTWPADHRPPGSSLHPKFIVVDDRVALVGSANLTGRALDTNIECGVLLRGGNHPKAISDHVWSLVRAGVLSGYGGQSSNQ